MNLSFNESDILEWGVDEIIGAESLKLALLSGKKLRVKLGIDPTSPNIHIGRSTVLWRLRAFQELGHHIDLLIGDFTGQVGDTSDKDAERPMLSEEKIQENLSRYLEQAWMILNPDLKDQVSVVYNSTWLKPLSFAEISQMADVFSVNAFIKRELISRRLDAGSRVSLREMLYPLMQGYDSVALKSNVELGGTDQRFNLLAGRDLQAAAGMPEQTVIMGTLISGTDGRKMSSSWGNIISLLDSPQDKFGKLMSSRDEVLAEYLLSFPRSAAPYTKDELEKRLAEGENPRDLKLEMASTLVELYHGAQVAAEAKEAFISQFSEGSKPQDIPETLWTELALEGVEVSLVELLALTQLAPSKSEARRLIEQGGVRVDDIQITDLSASVKNRATVLIQVGKRRFLKLS